LSIHFEKSSKVCVAKYTFPYSEHNIKGIFPLSIDFPLNICHNLRETSGGEAMRSFNYSKISENKWDSELLGLIAAIYKEAG
jgi:hypothetical protein